MIPTRTSGYGSLPPILCLAFVVVICASVSPAQNDALRNSDVRPAATVPLSPSLLQSLTNPHEQNIGDRKTIRRLEPGCTRGLATRYTLDEQSKIGQAYAQNLETSSQLVTDPFITGYVNGIVQNLARRSATQLRFTATIIHTDEVNAFSLPGGFLFLDSGLILAADDEAELAAVLSHEIAHVAACHAAQEMAREQLTDVDSMPLIYRLLFRHMIRNTIYLKPARSLESEADSLGIRYLYNAGYDPRALPLFLEKIQAMRQQQTVSEPEADSPLQLAERITKTQQEIDTLLPPAPEYKTDTSDFQRIKARLSELQKHP